jgi:oligoendopeptidase F
MDEMRWDLTELVRSVEPSDIVKELESAVEEADRFSDLYRGRINGMDAKALKGMLERNDAMALEHEGVMMYCHLLFSANTADPVANQLYSAMVSASTRIGQSLAFMEVELGKLLVDKEALVGDPMLVGYRHYLERELRHAPHLLSEAEERVIMSKDKNGIVNWSKLQSTWLSSRTFKVLKDGVDRSMAYGEIASFQSDPDRTYRRAAYQAIGDVLANDEMLYAEALRSIWNDHLEMCSLRRYSSPLGSSLIINDVEAGTISAMMASVEAHSDLFLEYYQMKAKVMGLDKLALWDILAPIPGAPNRTFTWEESRSLVVSAYRSFDPQWADWAEEMYERRHLDGEVGKRAGAFCSDWMAGRSAFILQSFNGRMNDVTTQAHEMGHAVHAHLVSRNQTPSNAQVSYCVAECGSIFGELLLAEQLLREAKDDQERRAVLIGLLDMFCYIVSNVAIRYNFEESVYQAFATGESPDASSLSRLWVESRDRTYRDGLEGLPGSRMDWARIPHHFMAGLRFYNYPYIFAQLFVFALYRLYKEQGQDFVPKMNALLAAGSSLSAAELGELMGFDIDRSDFWEKGFDQARDLMEQLKRYV